MELRRVVVIDQRESDRDLCVSFRLSFRLFFFLFQVIADFANGEIAQASALFNVDLTLEV